MSGTRVPVTSSSSGNTLARPPSSSSRDVGQINKYLWEIYNKLVEQTKGGGLAGVTETLKEQQEALTALQESVDAANLTAMRQQVDYLAAVSAVQSEMLVQILETLNTPGEGTPETRLALLEAKLGAISALVLLPTASPGYDQTQMQDVIQNVRAIIGKAGDPNWNG